MQQSEAKSSRLLKEGLDTSAIGESLTVEHLQDTTPTTLHRLFSTITKQLVQATVNALAADRPDLTEESYESTKRSLAAAIEAVVPFTVDLREPDAQLPFNNPDFMLGICNALIVTITILEFHTNQKEKDALREMLGRVFSGATNQLRAGDHAGVIVATSPADAMQQLAELERQQAEKAETAAPTEDGKPPVH